MRTRPGAWVARARLAAALGRPIPTKQVMPSRSARAAETVIMSSDVYGTIIMSSDVYGTVFLPVDVLVQPASEGIAVAADRVPGDVVVVVAHRVVERIGGVSPARHLGHVGHCP